MDSDALVANAGFSKSECPTGALQDSRFPHMKHTAMIATNLRLDRVTGILSATRFVLQFANDAMQPYRQSIIRTGKVSAFFFSDCQR